MRAIRRTKKIEGTSVPGIINNGGHYFYIHVDVYEDGMSNCWELVDQDGLADKINSGWLAPAVPSGEQLSIHGLGAYKVVKAEWDYSKQTYLKHFVDVISSLNPELTNLYKVTEREKQQQEARKITSSPAATDFYVMQELFYQTVEGRGFFLFMKYAGAIYLVNLIVYKDGRVAVYNLPEEAEYRIEEIGTLFADGTLFTEFSADSVIRIQNLGEVTLAKPLYSSEIPEKYKELVELHKKLNGQKTAAEECRAAYYTYLEYPGEYTRGKLKEKYELVPEHERMYLGDMDNRDRDYRRIIYTPDVKREV
ncbi:DUF7638 domain-containing protein [Paenibacillus camerounensis]|uniref:DUF7638 domain-containing protein n=1 Tax=Paenibacillus camerounensis TaxID=1243663 RepID=UPI0005AB3681|nr:hypothetical protein [Paenibacillus camerounensis]